MVEYNTRFRSSIPEPEDLERDLAENCGYPAPYKFGRSERDAYEAEASVPLFLADPDSEPEPEEFVPPRRRGIGSVTSKILLAVVAASGIAMLFAWFSSDATRDIIVNAKATIASSLPTATATAQADAAQLTPGDLELKAPAHSGPPRVQPQGAAPVQAVVAVANAVPSREEIASAYQNALQARAPVPVVPPPAAQAALPAPAQPPQAATPQPAPPQVKHIEPQELATLMKRAKDMLAMGDIPSARLLLERAAEGQDATAALMLARTYDPAVLGTSDVRNITPEPDKARAWYQKAAQLGSAEAQQRLAQLSN
jgi:hypothetical protein